MRCLGAQSTDGPGMGAATPLTESTPAADAGVEDRRIQLSKDLRPACGALTSA